MHVQVGGLGQIEPREIGLGVGEHVAAGLELRPAEVDALLELDRVGPAQVVIPGFQCNIAEDGPPVALPGSPQATTSLRIS